MEPLHSVRFTELISVSKEETQALFTRIGQILKAQVAEKVSANKFLLRFGRHLLLAETILPLIPGKTIKVRVEALRPKILLKLLPEYSLPTSNPLKTLELKDTISFLFKQILSWQKEEFPSSSQILFHNIQKTLQLLLANKSKLEKESFWQLLSGVCLGHKEEKSILEKLFSTFLVTSEHNEKKEIIINFLNYLSFLREINQHLKEKGFYIRWPFQWNSKYKDFEAFLGCSFFHFRIELEYLKKIEGIIRLKNQNEIYLNFYVENKEISQFIQENIFQLYQILEALGFKIKECQCKVANKEYWQRDLWVNWAQFTGLVDIKA